MIPTHLTVTVGPDYRLLAKFLRYYHAVLGVKNFLIILNTPDIKVRRLLKDFGVHAVYTWLNPFSEKLKQYHERAIINKYCSPDDWILYADLDEFQEYPHGLEYHINYCQENNIDFLEGRMIDRISSTGDLIPLDEKNDIERQFPLGGYLTSNLLKAWDKKIVLAKAKLTVGGGHHLFLDRVSQQPHPYKRVLNSYSTGINVHHFKWDSNLLTRMENYIKLPDDSLFYWRKEMVRFIKHFKKYNKINIKDKRFKISAVNRVLDI